MGRRQVKEEFLSRETIETWIVYVCHWEGECARQNIEMSLIGVWYSSWRQVHQFVSRIATLLGFSHSIVSSVYQEWSTTQRTSSQLDTNVGSIGVNMGQHPCGTISTPCRVLAPKN